MEHYIVVTDKKWFDFLNSNGINNNVNFWRKDTRTPKVDSKQYVFFKIKGEKHIAGRGRFNRFLVLNRTDAIEHAKKGNNGFDTSGNKELKISNVVSKIVNDNDRLGCLVLDDLEFLNQRDYYKISEELFHPQTQQGKYVDEIEIAELLNLFTQQFSDEINAKIPEIEAEDEFDPSNLEDKRHYSLKTLVLRRGQKKFRNQLLNLYQNQCAVTNTKVIDVLEAAHISPYSGKASNVPQNGIILRADIHALFDLNLIKFTENYEIDVSEKLKNSIYWQYNSKTLFLPILRANRPSKKALKSRTQQSVAVENLADFR